ncbi:MAG: beta-phosphoglucomutase family hydrolase, partial [Candidatus Thorarchaeota archaeon]
MYKFSFNAVIFDLDGVITQTATLHSLAWKKMFDEYLCIRKKRKGEDYEEFTHEKDYLNYVDGKPRYEGVKSFLESRGIQIPYGDPSNLPNEETICGLGNRKNNLFNELISQGKVDVYTSTIDLINELKQKNIKLGVASSSKNCKAILIAAGLLDLFDTMVDGVISSERGLKGKPEPDIFLTACNNLGVQYDKAVVVEDAVSGVKAGENGHFGLVIGVARENNEIELKSNGADIVVNDLEEITIDTIEYWFAKELEAEKWTLGYFDYDEDDEKKREALLTIGNGYFGTRGVMEEFKANGINYPGTYIAGVYNKLRSHIAGKTVINEDFVNCPNWLHITFKIDNNEWFNLETFKIINISRKLDFKKAKLNKRMLVKDSQGRESLIESIRIVSMHNPHIACLRYKISPLNYSSIITIKSSLDGAIINAGIDRYKQLSSKHLKTIQQEGKGQISYLLTQTTQSKIQIAEASKLIVSENKESISPKISVSSEFEGRIDSYLKWEAKPGKTICIDKLVAIYTSKDSELDETTTPLQMALKIIKSELSFKEVVQKSVQQWGEIWKKIDIELKGDRFVQKLLRLNLFHLMITYSPHNEYIDAGIPARGLHGEAYRGHIFWDTLFILPFYFMHFPQIAKSALLYRYRRLDSAREYAKECGYEGAVFPWQ